MSQDRFQAEVMDELRMQEECMMPWTLIMTDFLEQGKHWDPKEVATVLRSAQAEIDGSKKEWQELSDDDVTDLVNFWNISDIEIEPFIEMVVRKVKEKNSCS